MSSNGTFDLHEMLEGARDSLTVRRLFGDPIEHGDTVIVPAARVRGGAGGGSGEKLDEHGGGGGFGLMASPAGAFVLHGDDVDWKPAVNTERIVLASLGLAALVVLAVRSSLRHLSL